MPNPQQHLLNSYHDFVNYSGKDVYKHLFETFVLRLSDDVADLLAGIPHPYKEYVAKGQRMVMDHIRLAAAEAEKEDEETELTHTVTEIGA